MKASPKKKQQKKPKSKPKNTPQKSTFKILPFGDRVVIKESNESREEKTASGIIIPITAQEDKSGKRGEVMAVGDGKKEDGKTIPMSVKVRDKVLFQWGDKIKIDDEEYYIVKESEILAIIN